MYWVRGGWNLPGPVRRFRLERRSCWLRILWRGSRSLRRCWGVVVGSRWTSWGSGSNPRLSRWCRSSKSKGLSTTELDLKFEFKTGFCKFKRVPDLEGCGRICSSFCRRRSNWWLYRVVFCCAASWLCRVVPSWVWLWFFVVVWRHCLETSR